MINIIFWEDENLDQDFEQEINQLNEKIESSLFSQSRNKIYSVNQTYFYSSGGGTNRKGTGFDLDKYLLEKIKVISNNESHGIFYFINPDVDDDYNLYVLKKGQIIEAKDTLFSPYEDLVAED
ncbi:MAG: Imm7 family immunity protein [Crocinitomicaceae bacterium]